MKKSQLAKITRKAVRKATKRYFALLLPASLRHLVRKPQ